MAINMLILDPATHHVVGACSGPSPDGACPRVGIGTVIPCAGYAVVEVGAVRSRPFTVSPHMTLCPRTIADALAVSSDWVLMPA